jgi:hypothetical protein
MITQKEIEFIKHWESVRIEHSSFSSKMKRGLPMAILFSMPIMFSIAAVYFFSPEWYTKVGQKASGSFSPIFMAVFICILFFSYFRMHFKWEMNEQLYQELMARKSKNTETSHQ